MLPRFARATRGNLSITFAIAAVPIMFALGAATDYGFAVKTRAKMNAAADAAALSAVSSTEMAQSTTIAQANAILMFNAQVQSLPRLTYNTANLSVQVTDSNVTNQRVRTVVVTYTAASQTAFASILKMSTIPIGGTATATATATPNIDFYLMLDTSPSMAIPSTTDGIAAMVKLTPYQDSGAGCAFACHESNPAAESGSAKPTAPVFGNQGCPDDPKQQSGGCLDNYQLALNANIPLRITLVNQAVQNLVTTAQTTAAQTGAAYRLAGYTFDVAVTKAFALQTPSSTTQTQAAANINMLEVASENSNNGDQNTVFDTTSSTPTSSSSNWSSTTAGAFPYIYSTMINANNGLGPGYGTNATGDRPQQVLMLVTDGVSDQPWSSGRIYNPIGGATNTSSNINDWCTKIKSNSNIRIAVLYLVYNPLPMVDGKGNASWYAGHVSPIQSDIAPTLQSCASSSSLFYQVNTNGDISTAMSSLFQTAVGGAKLSY